MAFIISATYCNIILKFEYSKNKTTQKSFQLICNDMLIKSLFDKDEKLLNGILS